MLEVQAISMPQEPFFSQKWLFFFHEFFLKEWKSYPELLWNRLVFWVNPESYGLNPLPASIHATALSILLIPGSDGNPSGFLPLARLFQKFGIEPVYTVSWKKDPLKAVEARLREIGPAILIGHSLGGILALEVHDHPHVKGIIALGARLCYIPSQTDWFAGDELIARIQDAYRRYEKNKPPLHALWGENDGLVPSGSALPEKAASRRVIQGASHLGILFHPETLFQTLVLIESLQVPSNAPS